MCFIRVLVALSVRGDPFLLQGEAARKVPMPLFSSWINRGIISRVRHGNCVARRKKNNNALMGGGGGSDRIRTKGETEYIPHRE